MIVAAAIRPAAGQRVIVSHGQGVILNRGQVILNRGQGIEPRRSQIRRARSSQVGTAELTGGTGRATP
jgi:hypothetical protein